MLCFEEDHLKLGHNVALFNLASFDREASMGDVRQQNPEFVFHDRDPLGEKF